MGKGRTSDEKFHQNQLYLEFYDFSLLFTCLESHTT